MYLRKDRRKNGRTYLSIGENYRDGGKTKTRHLESIGYVDALAGDGCPDPVAFWEAEVARRNAEAASGPASAAGSARACRSASSLSFREASSVASYPASRAARAASVSPRPRCASARPR